MNRFRSIAIAALLVLAGNAFADPEEIRFQVLQVLDDGTLFVRMYQQRPIGNSAGNGGRIAYEWAPSDLRAFVSGVPGEVAEGEKLTIAAAEEGVLKREDAFGIARTLKHFKAVAE